MYKLAKFRRDLANNKKERFVREAETKASLAMFAKNDLRVLMHKRSMRPIDDHWYELARYACKKLTKREIAMCSRLHYSGYVLPGFLL